MNQQSLIDQAYSIENPDQRFQFIKNIPFQSAKITALSHLLMNYPQKLKMALQLASSQQHKEQLVNSAMDNNIQNKGYFEIIQSLQGYPKIQSIIMKYLISFMENQEAKQYAKTIPTQKIRYQTMSQLSEKIPDQQERLDYINEILDTDIKSNAMYFYSLNLPANQKTIQFILSIPDEKRRSEAMVEYSIKIPLSSRLAFIMTIPDLEEREQALSSYIDELPFGKERKQLIQTLSNDTIKSNAMQKYADLFPIGEQRKAYIKLIPDDYKRNYKLKKYDELYKKLKRKQKLINKACNALKKNQDTVRIDDYNFVALSKSTVDERNFVQLISQNVHTGDLNIFYVYQSNSEIGAWRYCRNVAGKSFFLFKGDDYITVTFIHIELQKYLFKIVASLSEDNDFEDCPSINKEDSAILNSRIQGDPVFDVLTSCSSSFHCFYNNELLQENAVQFSKKQQWTPLSIKKLNQISLSKPYLKNVKLLIQSINAYLQQYLSFDYRSFKPLYSYQFNISNQAIFKVTIFKGNFRNSKNQKEYDMFINHYHYQNTKYPQYNGIYSFITFVVPKDSKITKNGIYDKVIRTGIYAYKAVEYAHGMDIYADQKLRKKDKSITHERDIGWDNYYNYYFIGDIMNQFWPLDKLKI